MRSVKALKRHSLRASTAHFVTIAAVEMRVERPLLWRKAAVHTRTAIS
jgi:hypothetical protein